MVNQKISVLAMRMATDRDTTSTFMSFIRLLLSTDFAAGQPFSTRCHNSAVVVIQ